MDEPEIPHQTAAGIESAMSDSPVFDNFQRVFRQQERQDENNHASKQLEVDSGFIGKHYENGDFTISESPAKNLARFLKWAHKFGSKNP